MQQFRMGKPWFPPCAVMQHTCYRICWSSVTKEAVVTVSLMAPLSSGYIYYPIRYFFISGRACDVEQLYVHNLQKFTLSIKVAAQNGTQKAGRQM